MKYFDAHCHVQFEAYDADRDALLLQMKAEEVGGIVVGCDLKSSRAAVALAERHADLYASIGLHPNHECDESFDEKAFEALGRSTKVVAIGECGLDYYRPVDATAEVKQKQRELFTKHIRLAGTLDKPLIIHARPKKGSQDAYQDVIALLTEAKHLYPNLRGDIHFFVGGVPEAQALIALDFTVSFTAVITFARDYDEVIRAVPLESILAETDSPYVAPSGKRGTRNDPLSVREVVKKLAEIRGENPAVVADTLLANAKRLFAF
jgi:TatD DNase family protein